MENLQHWLNQISDKQDSIALQKVFAGLHRRLRSVSLSSAGLAIKAGGSTVVKTGASAWYGIAEGQLLTIAAATDMAALSGTVTADKFNVYVFTVDNAGTQITTMGTEAATLAAVKFPTINDDHCVIGFIIVNPTGTGNFVGGTTALDDGTVVPNVVYVNPLGDVGFNVEGISE